MATCHVARTSLRGSRGQHVDGRPTAAQKEDESNLPGSSGGKRDGSMMEAR